MIHPSGPVFIITAVWLYILAVFPGTAASAIPEAADIEPNNAAPDAGALSPGDAVHGYFQTAGDQDWYRVRIEKPARGVYEIQLQGVPGVDAAIEVYDDRGRQVKRINSAPRGEPERLANMGLAAGGHYIVIRGDEAHTETAYTLSFRLVEPWTEGMEFEANDNMATANPLNRGQAVTAALQPVRDQDWFTFKYPQPDYLLVELAGAPGINLYIDLYSTEGQRLMRVDYGDTGQGELLSIPAMKPGAYLVKVGTYDKTEVPKYRLTLREAPLGPPDQAELKAALRDALNYLAKTQKEDGAWEGRHGDKSGLIGLALLAFVEAGDAAGGDYRVSIDRCVRRLQEKYRPSSTFPEGSRERAHYGGLLDHDDIIYSQSIALTALIRTMKKTGDESLRPMIGDGLDVLVRSQNVATKPAHLDGPVARGDPHYGGWRFGPGNLDSDISVTAWAVFALREGLDAGFPVPPNTFPDAAFFVKNCYIDEANGFAWLAGTKKAGCARTASGVLALQRMDRAGDRLVEEGCRFILKHPPVWNMEQRGGGFPFYYWHHATLALASRGGKDWQFWRRHVTDLLLGHQEEDGRWQGAQKEGYFTPAYVTALGALVLDSARRGEAAP
jgi:hypothetical protein